MAATAPWQEDRKITRIASRKDLRDKSTIISIFPKRIEETKITVFPTKYVVEAGSLKNPATLVVGAASWWKDIPESNQLVEVNENSMEMCRSVINDYSEGLLGFTGDARPGLFFVEEEISATDALKKYAEHFKVADLRQRNWYKRLVDFADQIWSKSPNPAAIGSDMRLAAMELGLETKAWLANTVAATMTRCIACGSPRDANFPVCGTCNMIVDPEKFKALGIQVPTGK